MFNEEKQAFIKRICSSYEDEPIYNDYTFLSIIGRKYDENLISRIVVYILQNNTNVIFDLIKKYIETKKIRWDYDKLLDVDSIQVDCEVVMGRGRADIFVVLIKENSEIATITIENKIRSWEHNTGNDIAQTDEYASFVNDSYPNTLNVFYYLKPSFNDSTAKNEAFIDITYYELKDVIGGINDIIINDFISHIDNYLGEQEIMKFKNWEIDVAKNYNTLKSIIIEYDKKLSSFKESCTDKIKNALGIIHDDWSKDSSNCSSEDLFVEIVSSGKNNGLGSFRIYRNDWYKPNEYYFYVEIYFENGDICSINYQLTLRKYSNIPYVDEFIKKSEKKRIAGKYIVLKEKPYNNKDIQNSNWENSFISDSIMSLKECIAEMDETFEMFRNNYCR